MSVMAQKGLIALGCGEFGAAVAQRLAARAPANQPLRAVALPSKAATRAGGAEQLDQALKEHSSSVAEASRAIPGGALGFVAAADEAAGSGMLVQAAEKLSVGRRKVVWLALPGAGAGQAARARSYATLAEVEQLRREKKLDRCYLIEGDQDRQGLVALVADAMLFYALQTGEATTGFYAGFGVAVISPVARMYESLAPRLALRVLELKTGSPKKGGAGQSLPDLSRILDGLLTAPLDPIAIWGSHFSSTLKTLAVPSSDLETFKVCATVALPEMKRYYNERTHALPAPFDHARERIVQQIRLGFAPEALALGATTADEAQEALEAARVHLVEAIMSLRVTLTEAQQRRLPALEATVETVVEEVRQLGKLFDRKDQAHLRLALVQALKEYDEAYHRHLVGRARLAQMERLLAEWPARVEEVLRPLWRRVSESVELRALLEARAAEPAEGSAGPHALAPALTDMDRENLIQKLAYKIASLHVYTPDDQVQVKKEKLLNVASRELRAEAGTVKPSFSAADVKAWMNWARPRLGLAAGAQPAEAVCWGPATIRAEVQQGFSRETGLRWETGPVWLPGETVLYGEVSGVELPTLGCMAGLQAGYQESADFARQHLHVLKEPPGGWLALTSGAPTARPAPAAAAPAPASAPVVKAPAPVRETPAVPRETAAVKRQAPAPAQAAPAAREGAPDGQRALYTFVRAHLLGLVLPTGPTGEFFARYLDGQAVVTRELGALAQALRTLQGDADLTEKLLEQASRWSGQLTPSQTAGYCALLQWLDRRAPLFGEGSGALKLGIEQELDFAMRRLGRQAEPAVRDLAAQIGTARDSFTLGVAGWRYLRW